MIWEGHRKGNNRESGGKKHKESKKVTKRTLKHTDCSVPSSNTASLSAAPISACFELPITPLAMLCLSAAWHPWVGAISLT